MKSQFLAIVFLISFIIWMIFSLIFNEFSAGLLFMITILVMIVGVFVYMIYWSATASDEEKHEAQFGEINPRLVCPHCQTTGQVRTAQREYKDGISGRKAAGAVLTGGISILATGLSKKSQCTQAHCNNCNSTWTF